MACVCRMTKYITGMQVGLYEAKAMGQHSVNITAMPTRHK